MVFILLHHGYFSLALSIENIPLYLSPGLWVTVLLFTAPSRAPYGLAGALTIYNIKDTAMMEFKTSSFSVFLDPALQMGSSIILPDSVCPSLNTVSDSWRAVWKRLIRAVKPVATCDSHAVLRYAWKFGAVISAIHESWLAMERAFYEGLIKAWQREWVHT